MPDKPVAIVTGGANNIGYACVKRLSSEYTVIIADICDESVVKSEPGQHFIHCDITNEKSCTELFKQARKAGPVKVVVNSAGITAPAERIEDTDFEVWQRILSINLNGAFIVSKASISSLRETCGSLVHLTSRAGKTGFAAMGSNIGKTKAHYCASKAAVISLVKSLALELSVDGIRVNAVAPGPIEGTMIPKEKWDKISAMVPLRRLGKPEEIAAGVHFLVSEASSFITGHVLDVNGGTLMD